MTDIKSYFSSLKIRWVSRLLQAKQENWTLIPKLFLNKLGENFLIFRMNLNNQTLKKLDNITKDIPEFYLEIIKSWILFHETNNTELKNFVEIRKQVIWGNKFIKFQNKPLIMLNWIHSDFIYINDIIDDKGKIAQDKIFKKLRNTKNWIAEISKVKNSIPTSWLKAFATEESIKSKVYFNRSFININKENIEIENLSNINK